MASPSLSTVIIECPHCGTRYQVPAETIGAAGREVACAHCSKTWQAKAKLPEPAPDPPPEPAKPSPRDPDQMFDEAAERELDRAFEAEAAVEAAKPPAIPEPSGVEPMRSISEIKASMATAVATSPLPKLAALPKKRPKRVDSIRQHSPLTRLRRGLRIVGVGGLAALLVGGVAFRAEIVSLFPDMAGVYDSIGLGVNVVGLEFRDVSTLITRQAGVDRLQVDGKIVNVLGGSAGIPPVVVAILDDHGTPLYEWSVTPAATSLKPGEITDFSTQLNSPPTSAARVRLTFSAGRGKTEAPATATETTAHTEAPAHTDTPVHSEAPAHDEAPAHPEAPAHAESPTEHG